MGILDRLKKTKQRAEDARSVDHAVVAHLNDFLVSRRGVEAWLEPATSFNPPSILLVAADGEHTRRAVPSLEWAQLFCDRAAIPAYAAGVVGYPQRMRDWNARHRGK